VFSNMPFLMSGGCAVGGATTARPVARPQMMPRQNRQHLQIPRVLPLELPQQRKRAPHLPAAGQPAREAPLGLVKTDPGLVPQIRNHIHEHLKRRHVLRIDLKHEHARRPHARQRPETPMRQRHLMIVLERLLLPPRVQMERRELDPQPRVLRRREDLLLQRPARLVLPRLLRREEQLPVSLPRRLDVARLQAQRREPVLRGRPLWLRRREIVVALV